MANTWLNLYKGSPTSGGTDGIAVSTGDNSALLTFTDTRRESPLLQLWG